MITLIGSDHRHVLVQVRICGAVFLDWAKRYFVHPLWSEIQPTILVRQIQHLMICR